MKVNIFNWLAFTLNMLRIMNHLLFHCLYNYSYSFVITDNMWRLYFPQNEYNISWQWIRIHKARWRESSHSLKRKSGDTDEERARTMMLLNLTWYHQHCHSDVLFINYTLCFFVLYLTVMNFLNLWVINFITPVLPPFSQH